MDIPVPLQEALRDSITSGTFIDTKFWVFSKRSSKSGRVGEPKALFVNGRVVKDVPRLGALLSQTETKVNLRTQFPTNKKPYTGDYDYDADSDLEEDEDWDCSDDEDATRPVAENSMGKSDNSDCNTLAGSKKIDAKGDNFSDIISVSDTDSLFSDLTKAGPKGVVAATPTHVGAVLIIEDAAFVTFQALLRYLYTNEIEFAPWGSAERRKARAREETIEPPRPSPKSIYRLADKYDIPRLKELALRQIQHDISRCDIVEEVFSKFTSWYPELRTLELEYLARTLISKDSNPALNALKEKIKAYTCGELIHATDVLPALYDLMGRNDPFEEPQTQPPQINVPAESCTKKKKKKAQPVQSPASSNNGSTGGGWVALKDALTVSLTSGSFLDSQFYALDSRPPAPGTPTIRPIYFCSMAGGIFLSRLMKYSSRIWPSRKTRFQFVDDYDSEVDDEGSGMGIPVDAITHPTCIPEDLLPTYKAPAPALVLKSGTAKTWSAIFFYMYTSRIEFSPLSSRGIEETVAGGSEVSDRATSILYPRDQHLGAANASPSTTVIAGACSPKSIYALACKIELTSLRNLAFNNIQSQLDEKNIVQELFSPFTADHEPIRQMQHRLLFSNLGTSAEGGSFLETIRGSSSGKYPHRAVAMGHIFERIIRDCRERMVTQAKKPSQQEDPVAQPSNFKGEMPTGTPTTQPTTATPSLAVGSEHLAVQPPQSVQQLSK